MKLVKKHQGCLLAVLLSCKALGLVLDENQIQQPSDSLDRYLDDRTPAQVIQFADAVFECGVYYQYTAAGMKNNPGVPAETIQFVSRNSASLLQTADQLYQSAGISTQAKYDTLMRRAKILLQEQENKPHSGSDIIFEFGEKCRLLLVSYPDRLREISELLEPH